VPNDRRRALHSRGGATVKPTISGALYRTTGQLQETLGVRNLSVGGMRRFRYVPAHGFGYNTAVMRQKAIAAVSVRRARLARPRRCSVGGDNDVSRNISRL
jgi:hypothetical protein